MTRSRVGLAIVVGEANPKELRQMRRALLPEDEETMLRAKDLGAIYA